jgi:hypothetical protein
MKIKRAILAFFLGVMLIPLTCVGGSAELTLGNYTMTGYLQAGGGWLSPNPRFMNRTYFTQYVPFPEGALGYADLTVKSKDGLEYAKFWMYQPGLTDQDYLLQAGKLGLFHVQIEFDEMQHLYCTLNPFNNNIGIHIYRIRASGWVNLTPDILLFAENQFLRRTGSQAGSYVSGPNNPYNFRAEYLRPVDYKQNDLRVGGEYDRPGGQFRVAYHHSTFDNGNQTILGRPGVFNTIVSLPPSNVANYVTAEGAINMPQYKTRVTGSLTYGWLNQNDTIYDREYNDRGLAGLGATTLAAYISGLTRPNKQLALRYSYRAYNYENNNTANQVLREAYEGDEALMQAEQYSYLRQTVNLNADYKVNPMMAVNVGYAWHGVSRTNGQGNTSTNTAKVGVRLCPTNWMNLMANYSYSARKGSNYLTYDQLEEGIPLTYKFYSGSNTRNTFRLIAEVYPVKNITASVNCSFYSTSYHNSGFGLLSDGGWSAGADVSWRPTDRVALSLGYDHQYIKTRTESIDGTQIAGEEALITGDAGYMLWTSDTYDTIFFRGDFKVIPKKLDFTTRTNFSFSNSRFHNEGIPNLHENILDCRSFLTYNVNEHWACKVGYIFQYFNLTQQFQRIYTTGLRTDGTLQNDQRFNTLDGYYQNATAHLVQGFLVYKF